MRYKEKIWGKIRVRERESIYLYLERYVCLRCIDEEKKKIKYVNKIWFYLVYFMMLLGGRRKKKT